VDFIFGLAHAGEVGHYFQVSGALGPDRNFLSKTAGGTARAVSHRDKVRIKLLELLDDLQDLRNTFCSAGREELKRDGPPGFEDVFNLQTLVYQRLDLRVNALPVC